MAYDVIMPALGMAQDSGVLVAWLKNVGDKVTGDDPLMEVETDKSTMEVPAGATGTLAELRAAAGDAVPVGQVIAVIVADGEEAPAVAAAPAVEQPMPAPTVATVPEATVPPVTPSAPAPDLPAAAAPLASGRVLASPKARRLANERGIDLATAVAGGVAEPIHVGDLDAAAIIASRSASPVAGLSMSSFVSARCDSVPFQAFLTQMHEDRMIVVEPHVLVVGFAAAALREVDATFETITVSVEVGPQLRSATYLDPDLCRPSRPRVAPDGAHSDLIVRDMTASRVTGLSLGSDPVPSITIGRVAADPRGGFSLCLAFPEGGLQPDAAIALIEAFARRLESPLEHLI